MRLMSAGLPAMSDTTSSAYLDSLDLNDMPKLTTEPSRCGVVEGMIFSRLSPNGVRRMRMAPSPRAAM